MSNYVKSSLNTSCQEHTNICVLLGIFVYETYYLQIYGQYDAIKFMTWIYRDSKEFSRIDIKFDEFTKFKNILSEKSL